MGKSTKSTGPLSIAKPPFSYGFPMVFLWQTVILPGRVGFAFRFAAVT